MKIELFALATYPAGLTPAVELDVPDEAIGCRVELLRCTDSTPDVFPDEDQVFVHPKLLSDGAWLPWGSFGAIGGKLTTRFGVQMPVTFRDLELPTIGDRKLSFALEAAQPVRTSLTVEWIY